ncbi:Heavy metal-associated isoprenylated plant protein 26 [Platanthera zijinensis]|uniref:Heavy metal-associated isoprenylated plant protein 26 n=1 Tax=Platanthera zijinensis TaxID=2320716 RepID=A0AAP0ASV0_9ASPA
MPGEGILHPFLSTASKTCSERLLYTDSEGGDKCREWSDVDEIWDDLKVIFAYIDREAQQRRANSLVKRWRLLDPFLALNTVELKVRMDCDCCELKVKKVLSSMKGLFFINLPPQIN